VAPGVYATAQSEDPLAPPNSGHEPELKLPTPLEVKLTVPSGANWLVPGALVIVAMHLEACPTTTLSGEQLNTVVIADM
jgi:hypothetical protein